jgi:hypothetical protein
MLKIIAAWHDFYAVLGEASATLTGLLFVAATVGSGVFTTDRQAPLRVFLSASVVHFSGTLACSLVLLAPLPEGVLRGALVAALGLFGLGYSAVGLRDVVRDGLISKIDLEDRSWYVAAPMLAYAAEGGAGFAMALQREFSCAVLAGAMAALLLIAIHNAWDITVWSVMRKRG